MRVMDARAVLSEVHDFIGQIQTYPVTAGMLVEMAEAAQASEQAADFYRGFADDAVFADEEDLLARSEQVGYLNSQQLPRDELHVPEED
jgi:hypothetical protein